MAEALKARCVLADVRWRWTLKVFKHHLAVSWLILALLPTQCGRAGGRVAKRYALLTRGPELATLLVREAFSRPIANRRALGSYVGLVGTPFSSGGSEREQGIGKDGNRRVRAAMVELAWLWLRWQPDSTLSAWFRGRVGKAGGRIKKIMWRWPASFSSPHGVMPRTASFRRERR
jgi:hypothetical protein